MLKLLIHNYYKNKIYNCFFFHNFFIFNFFLILLQQNFLNTGWPKDFWKFSPGFLNFFQVFKVRIFDLFLVV